MIKTLYIHGLGQTPESWSSTLEQLDPQNRESSECIDLPALLKARATTYPNLYSAFEKACNPSHDPLILCGLSLGAVLALNYASRYPQNVKGLVLVAPQYKMPKRLLKIQNLLFRFMPKASFQTTGFTKADFITLCRSMMDIDLTYVLSKITCPVLLICGQNDTANMKATTELLHLLPHAKTEIIPHAKHEINIETSETLAKVLNSFYDELQVS